MGGATWDGEAGIQEGVGKLRRCGGETYEKRNFHIHSPLSFPTWPSLQTARPGWTPSLPTLPVHAQSLPASPEPRYYLFPLLQTWGSPCPTQSLITLLSLLEPTTLASGPSSFQRAGSVRDRVRKFTSDSPMAAGLQEGPPRLVLGPSTPTRLLGPSHISTTPASSSNSSSSRGPSDTSSRLSKEPRGTARPLAQLQSCPREEGPGRRGLAARPLENGAGGPVARSEEPSALLPVPVGTAEPGASMKTTFTIEIKDGRGQASTGRVLLPTGNQRAGRPPPCLPTAGDEHLQTALHIERVLWSGFRVSPKDVLGARGTINLGWHCPHPS